MARPRNPRPTYKRCPGSEKARCWVHGQWVYLGIYNSPESLREYDRICAELQVAPAAVISPSAKRRTSVAEIASAFAVFAANHYRHADGSITHEVAEYEAAFAPLLDLYADTPAADFGPLALQAYRQKLIDKLWCRTRINKQVGRVRRVFRWAAGQELVPASVPAALDCVQGLQKGRTTARESDPVLPVARETVEATLPFLSRQVRTMVELQLLTGMRPGEATGITLDQIDRSGETWIYRPRQHKTAHRGKGREIHVGPKAKAVLAGFLAGRTLDPARPLFSPKAAREEAYAAMRAKRKSKVPPSQANRRKANPKRQPRDRYSMAGYATAVSDAAERAGVARWHPNQLRHTFATEVRKGYGLEAAQVLLGHSRADVTQIYAERNRDLAERVVREVG